MSKRNNPPGNPLGYPGLNHRDERNELFQTAPVGLCYLDRELRFVQINDKLARLDGLSVEEHLGKTIKQVLPSPLAEKVEPLCRKVLETGKPLFGTGFWGPAPAQPTVKGRHWQLSLKPVEGEGDEVAGVCLVVQEDTDQVRKEQDLKGRLDFERLIADLSSRFVNIPAEKVDQQIEEGLKVVVDFLEIGRCTLGEYSQDGAEARVTHSYSAKGVEPFPLSLLSRDVPNYIAAVSNGEVFQFKADEIPDEWIEEKAYAERTKLKSNLTIPLHLGGIHIGGLGLEAFDIARTWTEEQIARLRLVGEIFANALARQRAEEQFTQRLRFEHLLAELSSRFVNLSADRVDGEIEKSLQVVVGHFNVDRGSVVMLSGDEHEMRGTHSFAAEGVSPFPKLPIAAQLPFWTAVIKRGEVYAMTSVDDLPPEAGLEKAFCRKMGIMSTVQVPLHIGGRVIGVIGFSTLRAEREWPEEVIERLRLICEIFSNALERQRAEQELEHQLRFEQLIADLSARFVNLPADLVDREIEEALQAVADFLGIGRCSLGEYSRDLAELRVTHSWAMEGIEPVSIGLITAELPNYVETMRRGEAFQVTVDEFPDQWVEEKAWSLRAGLKSNLTIPLWMGDILLGGIAFDSFDIQRKWSRARIDRLRLVGEIFANAVARQRAERAITRNLRFERLIADLSSRFINIPADRVDQEIDNAQLLVMEALGLQRCDIGVFSEDGEVLRVVHTSVKEGVKPAAELEVTSELPHFSSTLIKGDIFRLTSVEELPENAVEERAYAEKYGIKSNLTIPLSIGDTRLGAIAFHTTRTEREWSDPLVEQLRLVGEIFANAMARQIREREIEQLKNQLETENIYLREEINLEHRHEEMVAQSPPMKKVVKQAEKVAATDSTVLLTGETGTGKEVMARAIHAISKRAERVMVKVNCAALPSTLVESELFGREEGAFTGALTQQLGRFEVADGSTIFLDEISELPLELQAKLLRVLQEGEFERLGSPQTVKVDVRIIAATNRDLEQAVAAGQFREDLLYRLNVFPITIPPLRERREDVAPLVWKFVEAFGEKMGKPIETIPRKTMELIEGHPWPGNIRELRNVIERAMILTEGPRLRVELPQIAGNTAARSMTMTELEQNHIIEVLEKTGWKVSGRGGAAEILGLKPTTLESRMQKLGIRRPR